MKRVFIKPEKQEIQYTSEFSKFIDDLRELLIIEENAYWNILSLISGYTKIVNKLDNKYNIELFLDNLYIKHNLITFILVFTCKDEHFTPDKTKEIKSVFDFNGVFSINSELTEFKIKRTLWIN